MNAIKCIDKIKQKFKKKMKLKFANEYLTQTLKLYTFTKDTKTLIIQRMFFNSWGIINSICKRLLLDYSYLVINFAQIYEATH